MARALASNKLAEGLRQRRQDQKAFVEPASTTNNVLFMMQTATQQPDKGTLAITTT